MTTIITKTECRSTLLGIFTRGHQNGPEVSRRSPFAPLLIGAMVLLLACQASLAAQANAVAPAAKKPIPNSACMDCHGDKTLTTTNAAGREISLFVNEARLALSSHRTNTCASCHSDLTTDHPDDNIPSRPVDCAKCHEKQSENYGASVHGIAHAAGKKNSPGCSDCHDGHTIVPATSPESPLHFSHLAETCGKCHEDAAKEVALSVHGKAVAAGHRDAPTCTDCHSEHKIEALRDISPLRISMDVCGKCHASERMNTKYNLPADRVKTFFDSYHGLAAQFGSTVAANCSSCHGVHKILPSLDPMSSVNTNNLVQTCGKCHPGATEGFALGKVHVDSSVSSSSDGLGQRMNWWVRRLYLAMIFGVIGGMLLHNGTLFARKIIALRRKQHRPVLRMNLSQRAQHGLLALSFIVLAITGFALKYPDSWIARALGSSEPFRRWSHRVAGVVLLLVGAYHIFYVLFTADGRKLVRDIFPAWKDGRDVLLAVRHLAGLTPEKPAFARFGYAEKMEYWAVVWGTIIMGVTGLMIWFKIDVTEYVPRWIVDVAITIHYYEAILACLAIIVWHFYHVMFDPGVYPLNMACVDGRVTEEWQEEEHALESVPGQPIPKAGELEEAPADVRN